MLRPSQPFNVDPQWTTQARFGPIRLLGFDLEYRSSDGTQSEAEPEREILRLVLYWKAEEDITADYTVFVHLIGAEGLAAQGDAPPCGGACPTSLWQNGDVWDDEHLIPVTSLSSGGVPFALSVGWYEPNSGKRLPALSAEGRQWAEDRVPLCTLDVWPDGECSP
jgi:hypothetical protein